MAEPRFKPGDKVRIVSFKHGEKRMICGGFHVGDVLTIAKEHETNIGSFYDVKESDTYIFWGSELEFYTPKTVTIATEIPLNDKKMAHRIVNNLVDSTYYAEKLRKEKEAARRRWSVDEIQKAKDICVKISTSIIKGGGGVHWKENHEDEICCEVNYSILSAIHTGKAAPHHADDFNIWIGKCVSLCKASGNPVPDFILNKNMEG